METQISYILHMRSTLVCLDPIHPQKDSGREQSCWAQLQLTDLHPQQAGGFAYEHNHAF